MAKAKNQRLLPPIGAVVPSDRDYFRPLFHTLLSRKNKRPVTLAGAHVDVVVDALYYAQLFQSIMLEFTEPHGTPRALEQRLRVIFKRLLGRAENESLRRRYDSKALKGDWGDLLAGRPNPRYMSRAQLGLPSQQPRCAQHERWEWRCRECWARREPVDRVFGAAGLTASEAVTAIQNVYGFPSEEACYKALQRAGVRGLPSTWHKAYPP